MRFKSHSHVLSYITLALIDMLNGKMAYHVSNSIHMKDD